MTNYEKLQAKQRTFLYKRELREIQCDDLASGISRYSFSCRTCKQSQYFHTANTGMLLLNEHKDHYTWIEYMGRS